MENIFVSYVLPILLFGIGLIMFRFRSISFVAGLIFIAMAFIIFIWNIFNVEITAQQNSQHIPIPIIVIILIGIIGVCIALSYSFLMRNKIKMLNQKLTEIPYSIAFIAENIGNVDNSLGSKVLLDCLLIPFSSELKKTKLHGKKCKHIFYLNDNDTLLKYHSPKQFTATSETEMPRLFFSNFRKYKFYSTDRMNTCLYFTDITDKNVSFIEFYFKRFLYRFFKIEFTKKE